MQFVEESASRRHLEALIASEIADFFAGFGSPGEPDIESGEAQRLLIENVLRCLDSEK